MDHHNLCQSADNFLVISCTYTFEAMLHLVAKEILEECTSLEPELSNCHPTREAIINSVI